MWEFYKWVLNVETESNYSESYYNEFHHIDISYTSILPFTVSKTVLGAESDKEF